MTPPPPTPPHLGLIFRLHMESSAWLLFLQQVQRLFSQEVAACHIATAKSGSHRGGVQYTSCRLEVCQHLGAHGRDGEPGSRVILSVSLGWLSVADKICATTANTPFWLLGQYGSAEFI